jgi:beta-glucosidase
MHQKQRQCITAIQFVLMVASTLLAACTGSYAQTVAEDTPQVEARVNALLSKLSLEEKIDLIGGIDKFYIRGLSSINLPPLRMSDGPMGVREWGPSTAYPGGIALAASWNPKLAEEIGTAIGHDARARGVSLLLAPGVNLYRAPMAGRSFEYFGEDPVLAARIAVGYIRGVQQQGVIATIKHLAANNQEFNRIEVSSDVDERTLRELYLPVFEAAVKEGHVGAVMDAYNPVNGWHPSQSSALNCDLLKKDWRFDGIAMSDWGGTHNAIAAANACLDLEMPSGQYMNRDTLLPAIREGRVSVEVIDDKVRRILRKAVQFGLFDRPDVDLKQNLYNAQNRKVALDGALEGAVLLRNESGVLPLDKRQIKTLAVLGPNATPAVYAGGGSSKVNPYETVSTLSGLLDFLDGKANVEYDRGLPDLNELSKGTKYTFNGKPGAKLELFADPDFHGQPVKTLIVPNIEPGSLSSILKPDGTLIDGVRALRFTATYLPHCAGNHLFLTSGGGPEAYLSGQDQYRLMVNGAQLIELVPFEQQGPLARYRDLPDVKPLEIRFDYVAASQRAYPRLAIGATADLVSERAKQLAKVADAVVLAVGFDPTTEREGMDRTFELPYGQEELIRTVARHNKKVIVVLNAGGGVDMHNWVDAVPAILHTWYPGQEGGAALAQLLFGEHNPSGKLPITIDRTWESSPVHNSYYAQERKNSASAEGSFPYDMAGQSRIAKIETGVAYTEGLLSGYRYYSGAATKPLFPFGFGLSYTTFRFSNLHIGQFGDEGVDVTADVTNSGRRQGEEVVQLYLGLPSSYVPMPARELKSFQKIALAPGETSQVKLHLNRRALSYYDVTTKSWKLDSGEVKVFVGDSAEDTPLSGGFIVPHQERLQSEISDR